MQKKIYILIQDDSGECYGLSCVFIAEILNPSPFGSRNLSLG